MKGTIVALVMLSGPEWNEPVAAFLGKNAPEKAEALAEELRKGRKKNRIPAALTAPVFANLSRFQVRVLNAEE